MDTATEYPPNATTPSETISHNVSSPASLAIDHDNDVFVSNAGANTVRDALGSVPPVPRRIALELVPGISREGGLLIP